MISLQPDEPVVEDEDDEDDDDESDDKEEDDAEGESTIRDLFKLGDNKLS